MRDWTGLKAGDQVVFEGFSDPLHSHWSFEVGHAYEVVNSWSASGVGIKSGNGQVANFNWGFNFTKIGEGEAIDRCENYQKYSGDVAALPMFQSVADVIGGQEARTALTSVVEEVEFLDRIDHPDLGSAFLWSESPQGHMFWSNIHDAIEKRQEEERREAERRAEGGAVPTIKPFCVSINGLSNAVEAITNLQNLLRGKADVIEYDDNTERGCRVWSYFGLDTVNGAMFWDNPDSYGRGVETITYEEAVELLEGGDKAPETFDTFPTFSFKLRNGEDLEVRQWLKDNGFKWASGSDLTTTILDRDLLMCDVGDHEVSWMSEEGFALKAVKEIEVETTLTIEATWKVRSSAETEAKIAKLRQEIEELERCL